ncbi:MAG: hypothetical protein U0794_15500 [Isosphaeraceae bacterium]
MRPIVAALLAWVLTPPVLAADPDAALGRALGYLAREVPDWPKSNHCFSCHNNGDAARALYEARRLGVKPAIAPATLESTTAWLAQPGRWAHNGGEGPFSDTTLAQVQFTSALAASVRSGTPANLSPLRDAAKALAALQSADGAWPIAADPGTVGSPAGYGRPLATLSARNALRLADPKTHASAIARAEGWLLARPVASVMDASIVLLTLDGMPTGNADRKRQAFERLNQGQSTDGGWGPYVDAPPEVFDTALALLALATQPPNDATRRQIALGRGYLAATLGPDGSWPETTRPAGAGSYAERVSTTGWAALALLATRGINAPPAAP